jgi:telomere length regulation protein
MASENNNDNVREIVGQLRSGKVKELDVLLSLLSAPLEALGLLPPDGKQYVSSANRLAPGTVIVARHIPSLQLAIAEHILPIWEHELAAQDRLHVIDTYFTSTGEVALHAYATLLSLPVTSPTLRLLCGLVDRYPIDKLHTTIFVGFGLDAPRRTRAWEDTIRTLTAIPGKVANAAASGSIPSIPPVFEQGPFYERVCVATEALSASLSALSSYESARGPSIYRPLVSSG